MAKSMKNRRRAEKKVNELRRKLVLTALEEGITTRKAICTATGLKAHELSNLFTEDRDLYAKYVVRRKTITDLAADNIVDILNDPGHPQHFQASKYVLQTYKSDLDDTLESQDSENISVEIDSKGEINPVIIKFSRGREKDREDE